VLETRDLIDIEHTPFGTNAMALVTDHTGTQWYETVRFILHNECESEDHQIGECECPPDDYYTDAYAAHLAKNGLRLITWEEMED
jgi:hypothetical protein